MDKNKLIISEMYAYAKTGDKAIPRNLKKLLRRTKVFIDRFVFFVYNTENYERENTRNIYKINQKHSTTSLYY